MRSSRFATSKANDGVGSRLRPRMEPIAASNVRLTAFDPVKLDLAVMALVAMGVALVIARLDVPRWAELLIMAVVGVVSGAWIVFRTHRVARKLRAHAVRVQHRAQERG